MLPYFDHAEITKRSSEEHRQIAAENCATCQYLLECREWVKGRQVAGFAAGTFAEDRDIEAGRGMRLDEFIVEDVLRYTRQKMTAKQIAHRTGLSVGTIAYIRRTRRE